MFENYKVVTDELLMKYNMNYITSFALAVQGSLHEDEEQIILYNLKNKLLSITDVNAECAEDDVALYVFGKYSNVMELTEEMIGQNIKLHFILS